jgi:hypothetical protein
VEAERLEELDLHEWLLLHGEGEEVNVVGQVWHTEHAEEVQCGLENESPETARLVILDRGVIVTMWILRWRYATILEKKEHTKQGKVDGKRERETSHKREATRRERKVGVWEMKVQCGRRMHRREGSPFSILSFLGSILHVLDACSVGDVFFCV